MKKIIIIGGGVAGCTTALEAAKLGFEVTILEQNPDILQGTSARTPGRMGLGYHYFDPNTAKTYMEHTVDFMQQYPDCVLGNEDESYLRNGRYFIVKDSIIPRQELMARYDEAALHFEKMCNSDPKNKIFPTTHLHRTLYPREFETDVDTSKVDYAIETKEHLLDWEKFEIKLRTELLQYQNIGIETNFEVTDVTRLPSGKFVLSNSSEQQLSSDYVVNCSWQNIEKLDSKLGLAHDDQKMTSRLKLLTEVELPPELKKKPSMFFCVGPHAMFSNLGNGIGRITFAPITNFGTTVESEMPEPWQHWLKSGLNEEETSRYGREIIAGVSQYIPAMANAKVIKVIPGIVKSRGDVELSNPDSDFHKRDYSGVAERLEGWIDNAAMKLFYCLGNAKEVTKIIQSQESKLQKTSGQKTYRLICVLDSLSREGSTPSALDLSPNYLHIHALESSQLQPIDEFRRSLSFDAADFSIRQWGIPLELAAHNRSVKVLSEEIKRHGQIGIGSAARGVESGNTPNFLGGGEGFLFGNKNFRITKGGEAFEVKDDEGFWTFQVADFSGAKVFTNHEKINGRGELLRYLLEKSKGMPFVATFDVTFEENSFVRSNGIFPEDSKTTEQESLLDASLESVKGGHLVGGSDNEGDLKSLLTKLDEGQAAENDFCLTITSEVLLKPVHEVLIAQSNGAFRKPRTEVRVREAAIKIQNFIRKKNPNEEEVHRRTM